MATYTSKTVTVNKPAEELAAKFADFTVFEERIAAMPEEQRKAVGDVAFEPDAIVIKTPQMGQVKLRAIERTPSAVVLEAEGSPVPMTLTVNMKPASETATEVSGTIEVDIPAIIKPMIGPTMQKAADKFGELFSTMA